MAKLGSDEENEENEEYITSQNFVRNTEKQSTSKAKKKSFETEETIEGLTGRLPNVYVEAPESSQNTKDPSRKIYVKPHYCIFCKGPQKQLIRHLILKHSCEKDVQEIEKCPKKSEQRNKLCNLIRNRGDFSHNIEVLKSEKGNLVVIRRPSSLFCPTHYYPCLSCFGFFSKHDIWRSPLCWRSKRPT
jgi:hypothetical protein